VIPGQESRKKLDGGQTQAMIKIACRRPHENAESIVRESPNVLMLTNLVEGLVSLQVQTLFQANR
jgi:hypothetical protein